MLRARQSLRGMVTSPHHLASEAGLRVLRAGGNAVEAAVAAAAVLAVVYPHMNGIGGDAFWLVAEPGAKPVGIRACGFSGAGAGADLFRKAGFSAVPARGALAANTVAGTVSGWQQALALAAPWGKPLPLEALLEEAVHHAESGYPISTFQAEVSATHLAILRDVPGFSTHFLADCQPTPPGAILKQPALAATLRRLAADGLDSFYRGAVAASLAADFARFGLPLTAADLAAYRAEICEPLSLEIRGGIRLYNHPPPSQGLASLIILGLAGRLDLGERDGFAHVHGLVEATKHAFAARDRVVGDPAVTKADPCVYLEPAWLDRTAAAIDMARASGPDLRPAPGDTVWLGAIDGAGRRVSMIQSVYMKFGSGVVLPETGILWQNRGAAFDLAPGPREVGPRRLPFHTLNPAMADFPDGRQMAYGTMGADGQPQFQSALFSRYAFFGADLQEAVTAPRWLLGRNRADEPTRLLLEDRFDLEVVARLREAGHDIRLVAPFTHQMGHAHAIVRRADGLIEGASDPRSDGAAAGF
ncbi:MAG: gamma-glutamyltransferase family protein [Bauldia sp.]|nr:gamma-glutamyltransferase family protein [Bauldia sp.]